MASAVKDELREILDSLPDDATAEELIDALFVQMKVREGLRDLNEGRWSTDEEVRQRLRLDR